MYNFYLKGDNADPFLLPVAPDKFLTNVPGTNKIVDLISIGQFNILKEPGLRDFTLTILLPGKEYPFVATRGNAFMLPIVYLNSFRKFKLDKKPVRLIITRTLPNGEDIFDGNLLVSFEDYEVSENAGEEGDFWVKLKLKEYVDIIITKQEIIGRAADGVLEATQTIHRPAKQPDAEYTVKPGDTLWSIAKKEYGDEREESNNYGFGGGHSSQYQDAYGFGGGHSSKVQEIANANGIKNIAAPAYGPYNHGGLSVGGILVIPPKEGIVREGDKSDVSKWDRAAKLGVKIGSGGNSGHGAF